MPWNISVNPAAKRIAAGYDDESSTVPGRRNLVTTAAAMMMGHVFTVLGRPFVTIAIEMDCRFSANRNAAELLRRMRRAACPKHQDKHYGANYGGPAKHHGALAAGLRVSKARHYNHRPTCWRYAS